LSANLAVSGTCGGTATYSSAAAQSGASFEGKPALSKVTTQQFNLTGCNPATFRADVDGLPRPCDVFAIRVRHAEH
jgi:hypothetical protein